MVDYIGSELVENLILGDNVGGLENDLQTFESFFGDDTCTRVITSDGQYIHYEELYFRYLTIDNNVSFWVNDNVDYCICVNEPVKLFVKKTGSIIEELGLTDDPTEVGPSSSIIEDLTLNDDPTREWETCPIVPDDDQVVPEN